MMMLDSGSDTFLLRLVIDFVLIGHLQTTQIEDVKLKATGTHFISQHLTSILITFKLKFVYGKNICINM